MTTPRPDDLDALPGIVISTIRTITPYLVGWLIAAALWIARPLGLDLPEPDQPLDIDAPDGYETSEAAKTLVADILGTDFGGYNNGDLDTLAAADQIINRLVAAGWRPTSADPYFASEALLREIDRQRQ